MQGQEHVACRRRQILAEQNKPPWTPSEAAAGDKETGETNGETEEEAYLAATCAGSSPKISSMAAWCTILAPSQSSTYSGNLWTGYSWNMSVTSLATLSLSQGPAPSKQSWKPMRIFWRAWKSAGSMVWSDLSFTVRGVRKRNVDCR